MSGSTVSVEERINVLREHLKNHYLYDKNGNLHQQYQDKPELLQVVLEGIEILITMLKREWKHKKAQSRSVNRIKWNAFNPANFHLNLEHDINYTFEVNCCRLDSRFKPHTDEEIQFFYQLDDKCIAWSDKFKRVI